MNREPTLLRAHVVAVHTRCCCDVLAPGHVIAGGVWHHMLGRRAGEGPCPTNCPPMAPPRSNFSAGIARFLGYALGKKDVWAVTMSQLLDWMQHPVPASQMKTFMKKYACP